MLNTDKGEPWIRLSLRGDRRLDETTDLFFRYRLTGAESMRVELVHTGSKLELKQELKNLKKDEWAETTLSFASPDKTKPLHVDEIRLWLPKGAELWIDDVLLYVPNEKKK